MDLATQEAFFDATVIKQRELMFRKGDDYAGNEDRLSNFKKAGAIAGTSAEANCMNHIATKVARLGVLLNAANEPNNESIDDTLIDIANYAILLKMIRSEAYDIKWRAALTPHPQ